MTYYILSKDNCKWCEKAKEFLKEETVEVFSIKDHPLLLKLMDNAKLTTVPQIWIDDTYIGGYQELLQYK